MKNQISIYSFSLWTVWIGASLALGAFFFKFINYGISETPLLVMTLLALIASVPVFLKKRKLAKDHN
jgi:hypothetical protein